MTSNGLLAQEEDPANPAMDLPGNTTGGMPGRKIACWAEPPDDSGLTDLINEPIEMTSGDADISADGSATFKGPIEMRSSSRLLRAGNAKYDSESGTVEAEGGIEYEDPLNLVKGENVSYNANNGQFYFENSEFAFADVPARGTADSLRLVEKGVVQLQGVRYTSCPEGRDDWMLNAKSLEVNTNTGMGTARGASLEFKGVPFFYWPYFTYPVTDDRRSGLLFPSFGTSDRRGVEYSQPIYWNIKPNMDATFVPRYMSDRGVQLGSEYRFLTRQNRGIVWGDYLPDDDETGEDRWRYDLRTVSRLGAGWRGKVVAKGVSDDDYFEDMSFGVDSTSQTALSRNATAEYYDAVWSLSLQVQDYQTVNPFIDQDEEPYFQLPRIIADAQWYDGFLGVDYGFETETTYFTRDDSVKGLRANLRPAISRDFSYGGLYMVPKAAFDYTVYNLDDEAEDQSSTPDRAAPILTLDTGAVFERNLGSSGGLITLEPRALYTYIPERNQDDLPIFDTIEADFNLVQLYEPNRYVGPDRLGDANEVALGITSRIIGETGREVLRATLGQKRLLESSEVTLPGEAVDGSRKSSYIAELGFRMWGNWSADARYQLDSDERETERSSARIKWRPGANKAINVGYRYDRDSLEQTDLSFAWPFSKSWNAIGRYNWSIEDREVLDQYLGVEYSSCCWGLRILARQTVARSTGEQDETIAVQFVMKGLSNFGSESTENLRRGILNN